MAFRFLTPLLLVGALAGCVVVHDDPPPRRVYYEPAPALATTVVVTQDDEVHYVVYREYFGCTDVEISYMPHYIRYYGCTYDDLYFCWFVSRRCGLAFDVCWRTYWYDCGRSCDRVVVWYNVPRTSFFVAVGPGVSYPPVYHNTYVWYNGGGRTTVTFTNTEYVALVHMKVGCEYQGHPPATYFAHVQANNGNTGRVIVQNRDSCGKGGKSVTGGAVVATAPRPWTMPPQQKQAWHQQQQSQITKSETSFKENPAHKEQVQKVQVQQKTSPGGPAKGAEDHRATQGSNSGKGDPGRGPQGADQGHKGGQAEHGQKGPGQGQGQAEHGPKGGEQPKGKGEGQAPPPKGKGEEQGPKGGGNDGKKGEKGDKKSER